MYNLKSDGVLKTPASAGQAEPKAKEPELTIMSLVLPAHQQAGWFFYGLLVVNRHK